MFSLLLQSWNLYRKNFFSLAMIMLVVWVPCELALSWLNYHVYNNDVRHTFQLQNSANFFFGVIAIAGIYFFLSEREDNRNVSVSSSLGAAFGFWGSMLLTRFLVNVGFIVGTLLLILPGIYFVIRASLAEVVVVTNQLSGTEAIKESFALTKGKFWSLLGIYTLGSFPLIIAFLAMLAVEVFLPIPDNWIADAVESIITDLLSLYYFVLLWATHQYLQSQVHGIQSSLQPLES